MTPRQRRSLQRISTRRWLLRCAADWACIGGSFALMGTSSTPLVWFLAALIVGARQQGLGFLGHEGTHHTVHPTPRINDALANALAFWPLGLDVAEFRTIHLAHHRHLGTDADPEHGALPLPTAPRSRVHLALRFAGDCLGAGALDTLRVARRFAPRGRKGLAQGALVAAAFVLTTWLGAPWIVPVWFGIQLTTFTALFQLRLLTEHTGLAGTHRLTAGPLWRFLVLPHNTWCHDEHHRWPGIPCHRLPHARALTREEPTRTPVELIDALAVDTRAAERQSTPVA